MLLTSTANLLPRKKTVYLMEHKMTYNMTITYFLDGKF